MRAVKDNAPVLIIFGLTIASFVLIAFLAGKSDKTADTSEKEVDLNVLLGEGFHAKGEVSASATLVEFSDFQCPACRAVYPLLKKLSETYKSDLRIVYKHFPLPQHKYAVKAAEAAEAAGAQGKFFEYHDLLFENQDKLIVEDLKKYASDLSLDTVKFNEELDSGKYNSKVLADLALGSKFGVSATPTFFLNGKKVVLSEFSDLDARIKAVIDSKR